MPEYGESLSEREMEILRLVATGVTNREIAYRLSISVNTVKVHLRNTFVKLGAESRTEATMIAVREGWVLVPETAERAAVTPPAPAPAPAPVPPLPRFKRIALLVALALAAVAVALTWPRSLPQANNRADLPPNRPVGQPAPQAAESPWRELAQMPTRRAYLALAAANGHIYAIAGQTPDGVTGATEIYDPTDDIWMRGSDKPAPVTYVSGAIIGTDVYVPGGCDAEGTPTSTVEVYDALNDSWREVAPLPEPRCAYALAALGERLYLFGGWDGEQYVAATYIYDREADSWREGKPMSTRRGFSAAAALENRLYVVGGYDGEREQTTCADYDPATETWEACTPLTVGRGGLGLVALGGQLYAIGGGGWSSYLGFNERYNPTDDTWYTIETPLVGEWRSPGAVVYEAGIYAAGGWSDGYLSLNQVYEALPFRVFIPVSHQQ